MLALHDAWVTLLGRVAHAKALGGPEAARNARAGKWDKEGGELLSLRVNILKAGFRRTVLQFRSSAYTGSRHRLVFPNLAVSAAFGVTAARRDA